eukprot:7890655-Ditylum_brightwellii.AAC.1
MPDSVLPDTSGSGDSIAFSSCFKTTKNTTKNGNVIIRKETRHQLEPHQHQIFYEGIVKGLPKQFDLLSLTKVGKQLENVITSTTNVKKVRC